MKKISFHRSIEQYPFLYRPGINTIESDICISNDIFNTIKSLKLDCGTHNCLTFSIYTTLLLANSFDNKYCFLNYKRLEKYTEFLYAPKIMKDTNKESIRKHVYYDGDTEITDMCVSNKHMKLLWNYSTNNKKIDYIIKSNGVMDKFKLTESLIRGYRHIIYKADLKRGNYFKIPIDILVYSFTIKKLGVTAFTLYSLIALATQLRQSEFAALSFNYFSSILELNHDTIDKYIKLLEKYKLIEVKRSNNDDEFGDFISRKTNEYKVIRNISKSHFSDHLGLDSTQTPDNISADETSYKQLIKNGLM